MARGAAFAFILVSLFASGALGCQKRNEWRSRTIYQIMVDRFSTDDGTGGTCGNNVLDQDYCGGTFKGLENRLDYILQMGFNAIWISPVASNTPKGYHGYWPKNLYEINPFFSSSRSAEQAKRELKSLVATAHKKGIWVMLDVVPNHMGGPFGQNISTFFPFNKPEHYHSCDDSGDDGCPAGFACPQPSCNKKCTSGCLIHGSDYSNCNCEEGSQVFKHRGIEECRQADGLIDLNQTTPFVRDGLVNWHRWVLKEFDFDGFRVDSTKHVNKSFWGFLQSKVPCYMVGETLQGDPCIVGDYQKYLDGMLNYPYFYKLRENAFGGAFPDLNFLGDAIRAADAAFRTRKGERGLPYLGNFIDNHDQDRFCTAVGGTFDPKLMLKSALTFLFFTEGIPIVFQGTEKEYGCPPFFDGTSGGARNRRPIWWRGIDKQGGFEPGQAPLAPYIAILNCVRKAMKIWKFPQSEGWKEKNFYVFFRGKTLVVLTNQKDNISRTLPPTSHGWKAGDRVCNALSTSTLDCSAVDASGSFVAELQDGQPKVYVPIKQKDVCKEPIASLR